MKIVDLRSDTVTQPTPAMRRAMADADVGDDVYGEDPTLNRLQAVVAERLGKEAALFVPSGTMANQIALRVLTRPGEIVLAGETAHALQFEGGAAAALSGLQIETIGERGFFGPREIEALLPPDDPHFARVGALAIENTHNASGGRVWPRELLADALRRAERAALKRHLDGARLWNAAIAEGGPQHAAQIAEHFDTVSMCLSKKLGAPVGSLLAGSSELIREALRVRKQLGGAMRQAGILGAAGLHALEHHVDRLADDHENAARLAEGLAHAGFELEGEPQTNIVIFRVRDAAGFVRDAGERGIRLGTFGASRVRAVTHLDVERGDVADAIERLSPLAPQIP